MTDKKTKQLIKQQDSVPNYLRVVRFPVWDRGQFLPQLA